MARAKKQIQMGYEVNGKIIFIEVFVYLLILVFDHGIQVVLKTPSI